MTQRKRLAIIGLGLIGGSLGLALKRADLSELEIVGHDQDRGAENKARKLGAIDKAEHNLPRAVESASIVIVATPVLAVREVFEQIAPHLPEGCIVTDTASTKERVMEWAAQLLPPTVAFVGGHPMAGKETPGIDNAEAELFRDRAYAVCPPVDAPEQAVAAIVGLARLVGAEPVFLEPSEHDQYAAAVSHLPLVVSTALFTLVRASPAWTDVAPLAASGFRDVTRLASGDPRMGHDIFLTNREAAVHWLERMIDELRRYRDLLEEGGEELLETFGRAQMERDTFLAEPRPRRETGEAPDLRQELMTSLMGGWIADTLKKARELPAAAANRPHPDDNESGEPRPSRAERIAEDIRRDLEKLEEKRRSKQDG